MCIQLFLIHSLSLIHLKCASHQNREVGTERHIVWNLWIPCLNLDFSVKRMLIDPYFLQGGERILD